MEQWFDKYRAMDRLDESVDAIGPKGLQALCSEIGIEYEKLDMYILVWKLGATQSSCITRSEWMHAMYQWRIEHIRIFYCSCFFLCRLSRGAFHSKNGG